MNPKGKALKKQMGKTETNYRMRQHGERQQKRMESKGYKKMGHNSYFHPAKGAASDVVADMSKKIKRSRHS